MLFLHSDCIHSCLVARAGVNFDYIAAATNVGSMLASLTATPLFSAFGFVGVVITGTLSMFSWLAQHGQSQHAVT